MPWSDQAGKVMKKPGEYSTNPNTLRVRARKARLDPFTREVEQARASDKKAITRAMNMESRKAEFCTASPETRIKMLEQAEQEVMNRRTGKGYDAESKIKRFLSKQNRATPTSPSSPGSPSNMDERTDQMVPGLHDHMHQPARLHGASFSSSDSNPYATSSQYHGQSATARVDGFRPLNEASYLAQQHLRLGPSQPISSAQFGPYPYGPNVQSSEYKPASDPTHHFQTKFRNQEDQIDHLTRTVNSLTHNLVAAKHTIHSQEMRLNELEERMENSENAPTGFGGTHVNLAREAPKLRRIVRGIQKISDAATEVCNSIAYHDPRDGEIGSIVGASAALGTQRFVNDFAQHVVPGIPNHGRPNGVRDDNTVIGTDLSGKVSDNESDKNTAQTEVIANEAMDDAEEVKETEVVAGRAKKRLRSAGRLNDE